MSGHMVDVVEVESTGDSYMSFVVHTTSVQFIVHIITHLASSQLRILTKSPQPTKTDNIHSIVPNEVNIVQISSANEQ
jgi:hypothetical protein